MYICGLCVSDKKVPAKGIVAEFGRSAFPGRLRKSDSVDIRPVEARSCQLKGQLNRANKRIEPKTRRNVATRVWPP